MGQAATTVALDEPVAADEAGQGLGDQRQPTPALPTERPGPYVGGVRDVVVATAGLVTMSR
jgi:hypothetical protein